MYFHIHFQTLSSPLRSPLSPVPPVITDERFNLLCPQPKQIHQLSDEQNFFPDRMTISISPGRHSIHEYVLHQRYLLPLMYCPVQSTVVLSLTPSWCVLTRFFFHSQLFFFLYSYLDREFSLMSRIVDTLPPNLRLASKLVIWKIFNCDLIKLIL